MSTKLTKVELEQINARLSAELCELRSANSTLRAEKDALIDRIDELNGEKIELMTKREYPLVDRLGRHYRVEVIHGRTIKCFAPGAENAH